MIDRKLDEVAGDLDDLSIDVDELKEQPAGSSRASLDKIANAVDTARDAVNETAGDDT
jgi:hypothetical protein